MWRCTFPEKPFWQFRLNATMPLARVEGLCKCLHEQLFRKKIFAIFSPKIWKGKFFWLISNKDPSNQQHQIKREKEIIMGDVGIDLPHCFKWLGQMLQHRRTSHLIAVYDHMGFYP